MAATKPFLQAQMAHSILIPIGVLLTTQTEDRVVLERFIGLRLNVVALPRENLQQLHDSARIELCGRAGHPNQVLQEQKINIK